MAEKIQLGQLVEDRVTGFTGIATARIEYLNGCVQFSLRGRVKDEPGAQPPEAVWFDHHQLRVVGPGLTEVSKAGTGGPTPRDRMPRGN